MGVLAKPLRKKQNEVGEYQKVWEIVETDLLRWAYDLMFGLSISSTSQREFDKSPTDFGTLLIASEIDSLSRHQRCQFGKEFQVLEDHRSGAVPVRCA